MIPRDTLLESINELTAEEVVFRDYYNSKNNPAEFAAFTSKQPPAVQSAIKVWLRAEKGEFLSELTENTKELRFTDNVVVYRHSRYCPAFIHKHTFFEIIFVVSGYCINYIQNQEYHLSPGDLCIIAPGEFHAIRNAEDSIIYNILIKHYNFSDIFSTFLLQSNVLSGFFLQVLYGGKYQKLITFHTEGDTNLQMLLDVLITECTKNRDKPYISSLSESLLTSIFNCLALRHTSPSEHSNILDFDLQLILRIKQYIAENLNDASLAALSAEFNYSPTYLSKLIRKLTGYNLSNIIRRIRIDKACSLLSNTNLTVAEISEIVGYKNRRQFNRTFYELVCKTPTDYRNRNSSLLI